MAYFDDTTKAMASLSAEVEQGSHVAEAAGTQFAKLSDAIFSFGTATKIGAVKVLWDTITKAVSQVATVTTRQLLQQKQQYVTSLQEIDALRTKLTTMYLSGEASEDELDLTTQMLDLAVRSVAKDKTRLDLATRFQATVGETLTLNKRMLTVGGFGLAALSATLNQNRSLNQALIQANAAFEKRYGLVQDIFKVQTATGAASETLAESAQALVDYGLEQLDTFKENLGLVAKLKDGLGISAAHGAELVVTFERGLKQSAKDVADVIANIAAQTGLAAQKAAQYAIELARGLRLLGPMRTDATGVARAVEGIAARVEELGGNSQVVVSLYRQMLSGTNQGFLLRSLAGVPGPGALGNAAGAQRAIEGLGRSMQRIVTAGPGTTMYVAQLELAAQMHGVAADDVRNYIEALELTKKPLTEAQTLEKAYRQQTQLAGEAWKQLGNSLASLYRRGLTPVLGFITPLIRALADLANWIANTKLALYATTTAMVAGLGAAGVAMWRLTKASLAFVAASSLASTVPGLKALGNTLTVLGRDWRTLARMNAGSLFGGGASKLFGGGLVGIGSTALTVGGAVIGAGAVGAIVGTVIERYVPEWKSMLNPLHWLKEIARHTGDMSVSLKPSSYATLQVPAFKRAEAAAAAIAELVKKGDTGPEAINRVMRRFGRGLTGGTLEAFPAAVTALMHKQVVSEAYINQLKNRTTFMLPEDRKVDQSLDTAEKAAAANIASAALLKQIAADTAKREDLNQKVIEARRERSEADYWWLLREGGRVSNGQSYAPPYYAPRFGF